MDVVPAFLVVDDVKFPLVVDGGHVRIADEQRFPGLKALSYVAGHLVARTGRARVAELTQRQSLHHQALTAFFVGPDDRDGLGDGVVNWTRLAGRPLDLDDAYFVGTTWIPQALVMPRHTLMFESALASEAHAALSRLGLTRALGYHDAVQAMAQYLASPERAVRFPGEPVPSVTAARVSLDWFRTPSGYRPDGVTEHEWLALCEKNFATPLPSSSAGQRYVRLCGAMHQLLYRAEVGPSPCLWRALRAA